MSKFGNLAAFPAQPRPAPALPAIAPPRDLRPAPAPPVKTQFLQDRGDPYWEIAEANSIRKIGLFVALALVFIRFSFLSEILDFGLGFKAYLVVALGPPAILFVLFSGGLQRCFRGRAAYYFAALMGWLLLVTPFSAWKGGTIRLLVPSFETEFSMFFIVAGLALTLKDCHKLFNAIAIAGVIDVVISRIYSAVGGGRLSISFGTLENPNDYATHLLVVLPFLVLVALAGRFLFTRIFALLVVVWGLYLILLSGSRSALLALAAALLFAMWRASAAQRLAIMACTLAVACATVALTPHVVLMRYVTLFMQPQQIDSSIYEDYLAAEGSQEARTHLLKASLALTLQNPLFGVGPGQFSVAEADQAHDAGRRGAWQVTHNSYTEVSSEAGIPALIFFLAAIGSSVLWLNSIIRKARNHPSLRFIRNAAFCLLVSFTGFAISIFFASMAYRYYLPTLLALTIVFARAAEREIRAVRR